MIDKIYIVMGSRGEYSERQEWPEIAFVDEKKAKEYIIKKDQKVRNEWIQKHGNNPRDIKAAMEFSEISIFYLEGIDLVKP